MVEIVSEELLHEELALFLLSLRPWVEVYLVKHEASEYMELLLHRLAHAYFGLAEALLQYIQYHGVYAFAVGVPQYFIAAFRYFLWGQHPCPYGVVYVVVYIRYPVRKAYRVALQCAGGAAAAVVEYSVPHLVCEVQAPAVVFQLFHHANALLVVGKTALVLHKIIQHFLAGMTEGRMAKVMAQSYGFG